MYRIAVCDDDKNIREQVRKMILEWKSQVEVRVFFRKGADGKLPALRRGFS